MRKPGGDFVSSFFSFPPSHISLRFHAQAAEKKKRRVAEMEEMAEEEDSSSDDDSEDEMEAAEGGAGRGGGGGGGGGAGEGFVDATSRRSRSKSGSAGLDGDVEGKCL